MSRARSGTFLHPGASAYFCVSPSTCLGTSCVLTGMAASRELLKYWTRVSGNRWLIAKMFGVLVSTTHLPFGSCVLPLTKLPTDDLLYVPPQNKLPGCSRPPCSMSCDTNPARR